MSKTATSPATDRASEPARRTFNRLHTAPRGVRPSDLAGKAGKIASVLEHRLVSGKYRFGETLSIYALAEQFDASRQPVAAAVVYLRSIGYLEVIPQVGCRVVSPSAQEVIDFYRMYSTVEAVISGLAAQRHEGGEAAQLVGLAERLAASPFQTDPERWTYGEGVTEFHKMTGAMARSATLVERISSLRRISRFYLWQGKAVRNPNPDTTEYMNRSRIQIAHAIAERDSNAAEQLTAEHIRANPGWVGIV